MEIIISDRISGYGKYMKNLFDSNKVVKIKVYNPAKFKKYRPSALLIFVVTDVKQVSFLKGALDNHFEKAIICTDIVSVTYLSITKPHVFVSLNQLKKEWMKDVLRAIVKLNGKKAKNLFNRDHNTVVNFLTTNTRSNAHGW